MTPEEVLKSFALSGKITEEHAREILEILKSAFEAAKQEEKARIIKAFEAEFGDGNNRALVIIESHEGGVSQLPALNFLLSII